jgi:hypothetical protein
VPKIFLYLLSYYASIRYKIQLFNFSKSFKKLFQPGCWQHQRNLREKFFPADDRRFQRRSAGRFIFPQMIADFSADQREVYSPADDRRFQRRSAGGIFSRRFQRRSAGRIFTLSDRG